MISSRCLTSFNKFSELWEVPAVPPYTQRIRGLRYFAATVLLIRGHQAGDPIILKEY
jgi:hypothetical protein